jgi:hypothetical protein
MSDVHAPTVPSNGHDVQETLLHKICRALNTERTTDETAEEFKVRVVTEFSNLDHWPDDRYETLDKDVQDWVYDATTTHKNNRDKRRKKALPIMPGLDQGDGRQKQRRGRQTLNDDTPARRGRARTSGEDCLTRTMKLLVADSHPENLKAADLVTTLNQKYDKEYSTAAVRYAQQAFLTARELLRQSPQQLHPATQTAPQPTPTPAPAI